MSGDRRARVRKELESTASRAEVRERILAIREEELAELQRSLGSLPPLLLAWRLLEIRRKEA